MEGARAGYEGRRKTERRGREWEVGVGIGKEHGREQRSQGERLRSSNYIAVPLESLRAYDVNACG